MAKTKKRDKTKRRVKGAADAPATKSSGPRAQGGSMMSLRDGFKGIAGSMVGKQASNAKTKRLVEVFWWVLTAVVLVVAALVLYNRFSG